MQDSHDAVVPRLSTPRLLLRELRTTDFDAYARSLSDPVATRFTSGVADRRAAWRTFAALTGPWLLTGAGWWAIELRATGEFIGTVGGFFREPGTPLGTADDLELGWTVLRAHWRRGFATEAARAALGYGLSRHHVPRAIAHVDPENVASIGVCAALGMILEGEVDFYGTPSLRYAALRGA